jgi:predicted porin
MSNIKKLVIVTLFSCGSVQAAEIFNADGNKLDFYGSIRARHYFSSDKSVDGDNSYMRMGLKGQTRISDDLTGYGRWETNIQLNNSEAEGTSTDKTRYGYAGISSAKWGSIDYGRNDGVMYDVTNITDFAPIFDILTDSSTDGFMTSRATGLLTYRNKNVFGLTDKINFALQYQGANGDNSSTSRSAYYTNGDGAGASVSYHFDWDGTLLAAYSNSKRTEQQNQLSYGNGDRAEMWAVGLKYDPGQFYAAVLYSQGLNIKPIKGYGFANKSENFETYVRYVMLNGIIPGIGWFHSEGKNIENYGDVTLANYIDVSTSYFFNKNLLAYADYQINLLDNDTPLGISHHNSFGVGLTYQF